MTQTSLIFGPKSEWLRFFILLFIQCSFHSPEWIFTLENSLLVCIFFPKFVYIFPIKTEEDALKKSNKITVVRQNFERGPLKDHSTIVWSKLAERFQRRFFCNCGWTSDNGPQVMSKLTWPKNQWTIWKWLNPLLINSML